MQPPTSLYHNESIQSLYGKSVTISNAAPSYIHYAEILEKMDGRRATSSGELSILAEFRSAEKIRGLSLAKLLKVGSICVAIACLETLLFLVLGEPEYGLLNPFAALFFLIASPFFYAMGKYANY